MYRIPLIRSISIAYSTIVQYPLASHNRHSLLTVVHSRANQFPFSRSLHFFIVPFLMGVSLRVVDLWSLINSQRRLSERANAQANHSWFYHFLSIKRYLSRMSVISFGKPQNLQSVRISDRSLRFSAEITSGLELSSQIETSADSWII